MQGRIEIINGELTAKIPYELMKEGDRVIVYTHALDLCGYGATAEEAKKDFDNALDIFFKETREHDTLDKALEELGWKKIIAHKQQIWEPSTQFINASIEEYKLKKVA